MITRAEVRETRQWATDPRMCNITPAQSSRMLVLCDTVERQAAIIAVLVDDNVTPEQWRQGQREGRAALATYNGEGER